VAAANSQSKSGPLLGTREKEMLNVGVGNTLYVLQRPDRHIVVFSEVCGLQGVDRSSAHKTPKFN
jgi:hypothetical protein